MIMTADGVSSVPVIDLAKFEAEKTKLAAAVTELGCFRVINHGIAEKIMLEMKDSARHHFDLPSETKQRNADVIFRSGYVKPSQTLPFHEAFGIYDASSLADINAFCSHLDLSSRHRQILITYASELHELIADLATKVADSLGVAGCSFKEWSCHLRMHRFNFSQHTLGSCGAYAHTDHGFLTILHEDESNPGLEIMDSAGNYLAVDPVPGTFLVNVGDIGKVWSNGRLHNVNHRVVCRKAGSRITIVLFMLAPKDDQIEPHAEMMDSEHPRQFRGFDYVEYRVLKLSTPLTNSELLLRWAVDEGEAVS